MKSRGRKKVVYDESFLMTIIRGFVSKSQHSGILKYSDIFNYSKELYEENKIEFKLSEDFWRKEDRQGRKLIDDLNDIYLKSEVNQNKIIYEVVDTEEEIKKFFKTNYPDRSYLINRLKINEKFAQKYIKELEKNRQKDTKIKNLEQDLEKTKNKIEALERALFSLFSNSKIEDIIENLLYTGKTKNKLVDHLFDSIFDDSEEIYQKLNNYYPKKEKTNLIDSEKSQLSKLIIMHNDRKNKS